MSGAAAATTVTDAPRRPVMARLGGWLGLLLASYLLYWGWAHRERFYFNPEQGLGYALGIIGGSLMLLLLLYPLRKHLRPLQRLGAVRHWFRMHMLFGVVGPVAILFHCNFSLGATNSNVALLSMVVVASSGLIGRFLYVRIHRGLYGRLVSLDELRDGWEAVRKEMGDIPHALEAVEQRLTRYERPLREAYRGTASAVVLLLLSAWRRWRIAWQARRCLRREEPLAWRLLRRRLDAAAAVYRFNAYERLFSLWHLLHMPLFVMLVITGIIHVVAVHVY
jgi:hypothetical protein